MGSSIGKRGSLLAPVVISSVAGLGLYVLSAVASDLQTVWASALLLGATGWSAALGLSLMNYELRFVRWNGYIARLDHNLPIRAHLGYYLAGLAFTATPGKVGEAARALYLKRHGVTYTRSLAAYFVERLLDVVAMGFLARASAFAFEAVRWPVILIGALGVGALTLLQNQHLTRVLGASASRLRSAKLCHLIDRLQHVLSAASLLMRWGPLYSGLFLGMVAWGAEGYALHLILGYLNADSTVPLALGVYSASVLIGALSFIPGGLGSTEAAMVALLNLFGVETPTAVAATLICRVATLWFAVVIGFFAVAALQVRGDRATRGNLPNPLS